MAFAKYRHKVCASISRYVATLSEVLPIADTYIPPM